MSLPGSTKRLKPTLHVVQLPQSREPVDCGRLNQTRTNTDHPLEFVLYRLIAYFGTSTNITFWLVHATEPWSSPDTYNPIYIQLPQTLKNLTAESRFWLDILSGSVDLMPPAGLGRPETADLIPRGSPVLIFFVGSMFRCLGVAEDYAAGFHPPTHLAVKYGLV